MSQTQETQSGSFDSLNVSTRCDCREKAQQMRPIELWLNPVAYAMVRYQSVRRSRGDKASCGRRLPDHRQMEVSWRKN